MAALAVVLALAAGCVRSEPTAHVPMQPNAAAQYKWAVDYREERQVNLIGDPGRLADARAVVRQTFQKVVEYFPEDQKFTPLAKLEIADMTAGLDVERLNTPEYKLPDRKLHQAIGEFDRLIKEYPDYEFIQAKALYDQGLVYLKLNDYDKAQENFLQVRDRFSNHKDKTIANLGARAGAYYNRTYVNK